MSSLTAFYKTKTGSSPTNSAESGDSVQVVFTDPPTSARDIVVDIIEVPEGANEDQKERPVLSVRGAFSGQKFSPDSYSIHTQNPHDPTRAPEIKIQVGEGAEWPIGLPDDREENGRFDLRLDITDQTKRKRKGVALLHVFFKMDVMIIPATAGQNQPVFGVIRTWAKHWKDWAPATRAIVPLALDPKPFSTPLSNADFIPLREALKAAVTKARGGRVGLAAGHGGGETVKSDAWVNLVPEDRKPVGMPHDHYRLMIDQPWLLDGVSPVALYGDNERSMLHNLSAIGQALQELKKPLPEELRLLTCNSGKTPTFIQLLADRLRVPMRAYTDYLVLTGNAAIPPVYYACESDPAPTTIDHTRNWPSTCLSAIVTPGIAPTKP